LTEAIKRVRLVDSPDADALIQTMLEHPEVLQQMTQLELPGCTVSDEAVLELEGFQQLQHLDLSRTPITAKALWIVDMILDLTSINIDNTAIGWWTRRKVRSVMRRRQDVRPPTPF